MRTGLHNKHYLSRTKPEANADCQNDGRLCHYNILLEFSTYPHLPQHEGKRVIRNTFRGVYGQGVLSFGVSSGMGFIIVLSRFYHFSTARIFVIFPRRPVRGDGGVVGGCLTYDTRPWPYVAQRKGVNLHGLKNLLARRTH